MEKDLSNWRPCERAGQVVLKGRYAHVTPLDARHMDALYNAVCDDDIWTYLPEGPADTVDGFAGLLHTAKEKSGWATMVICDAVTSDVLGMASYMRNRPEHGSTEVGCVAFSKKLQRSRIATEAMYLMAAHVFNDLGYRRYEWKCDDRNKASMRAALRFGFQYEGLFRNDMVRKGQNRNTAWYAMTDTDWPDLEKAFSGWLDPDNFDGQGVQKQKLVEFRPGR